VEDLVGVIEPVTKQRNHSFASKFAHFFLDANLPILGSYAEGMVEWHLGMALESRSLNGIWRSAKT
jgi:hypothetical protein